MKQRSLKDLKNGNDLDKLLVSKFNFVDLASSERLEEVGVLERRSKEEMSVISDLADLRYILTGLAKKEPSNSLVSIKHPQVPFFDSNLTSFLKDSLEGNSYILLLACVSPSEADYTETLQTLNYASQARYKKGYHEERPDELCYLNTQLYQLKNEVVALRDIHSNRYLEDQVKTLRDEMNSIRSYIHSLTDELIQAKTDKDALVIQLNSTNKTAELNPVIQEYAYQVQSLKLQVAETRMELEAANNVLRQTSENTNKWVPNSASTSHLYDLEKCNLKYHHTTASSERRPIKRKHTFKVKAAFLPSHRHKGYNEDLTNNADEFMDSLQNESKDEKVLHEDIQQTFEDFSFPLFENHSTSFEDINKELRIPSPPYIRSSSPSNNSILLDGEEDTLEALAVPAWSDEVKDEVKDDTTKRTSISVDSMWDDTDSSITTSYNNSSTADIPIITSSTTENMLKGDRKQKKKLLKMLHQVQADSLVKRELVGRLEKTEDLYTQMRTTYEDKLNKLKEHLLEVQKERDVALSRKPMSPVASTPIRERPQSGLQLRENRQASELRLEYEVKVKNLIAENQALRKKNTQITQASRTTQIKTDSFIRQLQADIETLNAQKKQLTKNIKAETDSAKEASSQYEREIQQLKRREITALEAKKKLEEANEVQNQLITKRSEETAAANAQVRKLINTLRKAANAGTFLNEANLEKILDGTFVPTPTNVPSRRSTVNSTD
ncbi:hypothetical protein G6F57_001520 [Rhizopus arrhizus]|nr:hypothetical protein G6F30_002385 [Rhizopus arrhizus]KAG1426172.1 hypothetical protein G6F58_001610 [Rhizopus delemar]KAG0989491.1 hypothetical protein G6F29_000972 [Rhizopus arrhizus]KAG0998419.1 hypothetical protein G6F28_001974 [Rhizopus arrhizus]KAG1012501.1 hypothetical protein G6F27_002753 [Rhizopus arrhizus]